MAGDSIIINYSTTTVGVAGQYYDQMAVGMDNTSGNVRLAAYDESGGEPTNLLGETGSIAAYTGYGWKPTSEFALGSNNTWLAILKSTASNVEQKSSAGNSRGKTFTYGAPPNPAGSGYSSGTELRRLKISHT